MLCICKPRTRWGSTEAGLETTFEYSETLNLEPRKVHYKAEHCNSVEEVEQIIKQTTGIHYKLKLSLMCDENDGPVAKGKI